MDNNDVIFVQNIQPKQQSKSKGGLFCICFSIWTGDKFMFECTSCNNWYHQECLKLSDDQINDTINDPQ